MLSAVDRGTFETVWAYKVGARPMCASSPVIAHGRVYVGTEESGFVCAGEPAPPERPVWSGRLAGPERAGNYFGSPASDIGKLRWNWPSSLDGSEPVTNIAAPLAVLGEIMLVPIAAGTNDGIHPGVICLPAQSSKRSGPDAAIWRIETANGVRQSPAIAENLAFFVDGTKGETGRNLHAVDARKGHVLWRRPVSTDASGAFAISATDLLIQDQAGKLSALEITDKAGRELWSVATLGTMEQAPAAFRQWVAAATVAPATLSLLDRQTGRALWTVNLANTPAGSPFFSKGVVYLATSGGIEARSLTNGQPLPAETWQPPAAGVSGDVAATAKDLIYVSTAGELVVVDRATGRPRFSPIPGALAGSSPLPGGSTVLYMGTEGNVMRLSLDTTDATAAPAQAKPREWLADTAAMGKPTTPMVLSGGSVYMGVSGWGLVCLGAAQ
ncbi:MAG: hypothetical protein FJ170_07610 [Gammaproteobacteria bacterium]|nr:hypothetical protein [Gammaproteobacteria bacterium]